MTSIQGLFASDVCCELVELDAEHDELYPSELNALGRVVDKRLLEYRAGRHCARRALAKLGIHDFPLINGPDRAPHWPAGVAGSLTHTGVRAHGLSAAVVARTGSLRSLGIDAELDTPLADELGVRITTPEEWRELESLSAAERSFRGKLIFCAKEAFYKCQYPLTRSFIDFQGAEVRADYASGSVAVSFVKPCGEFGAGAVIHGRFERGAGVIIVGMTLR